MSRDGGGKGSKLDAINTDEDGPPPGEGGKAVLCIVPKKKRKKRKKSALVVRDATRSPLEYTAAGSNVACNPDLITEARLERGEKAASVRSLRECNRGA